MSIERSTRLRAALQERQLVRFGDLFEDGWVHGYILDAGPRWFLLAVVSDAIRFDGFNCFRLSDVRALEVPDPQMDFVEAALAKRREKRPRIPPVRLDDTERLLRSAGRAFPLVTIHRQRIDPEVCQIGRVVSVSRTRVSLLEIDADAGWDDEPTDYQLREITRVDFGGSYEDAMYLVGGEPAGG